MGGSIQDIMQKLEIYGLDSVEVKELVESILEINNKFRQTEKEARE